MRLSSSLQIGLMKGKTFTGRHVGHPGEPSSLLWGGIISGLVCVCGFAVREFCHCPQECIISSSTWCLPVALQFLWGLFLGALPCSLFPM